MHSTRREPSASALHHEQPIAEADPDGEDGATSATPLQALAAGVSLMSSIETAWPHNLSVLNPPAVASLGELLRKATTTSAAPPAREMATRDGHMCIYGAAA